MKAPRTRKPGRELAWSAEESIAYMEWALREERSGI